MKNIYKLPPALKSGCSVKVLEFVLILLWHTSRTRIGLQLLLLVSALIKKKLTPALESGCSSFLMKDVNVYFKFSRTRIGLQRKAYISLYTVCIRSLSHASVGIVRIHPHLSASIRIVSYSRGGACPTGLRVYPLRGTPRVYYLLHKNLKFLYQLSSHTGFSLLP